MIKHLLAFSVMALFLLVGCAGPAANQPATETQAGRELTVFRSPT